MSERDKLSDEIDEVMLKLHKINKEMDEHINNIKDPILEAMRVRYIETKIKLNDLKEKWKRIDNET